MSIITVEEVTEVLTNSLPKECFINVVQYKDFSGCENIGLVFAASHIDINNVRGQKPQKVSLGLSLDDLELKVTNYGGMGGRSIYRDIDENNPKERYLAMKNEKIPFRKPKAEKKFILTAIERFALNWLKTLKKHENVLRYKDIVNYDVLLKDVKIS